ncbi:dipeptide ABC transporter ATP-binding protein [Lysinibacillus sp. FSL M8-0216]|uniref:Peptide/nickel transport system ATP-binding protein n=1 Tax=Lysinibacillus fusiformis TaxID=28031 RepID=A0A1H9P286_9BACI|nr:MULTISPECIES: dipeptide ABC transporter ATP-binding protein [Lysinibacillus]HAU35965.1 dipeptide ABC transporter ATP-binding protein [Lysinibacillus sp.]MED4671792.1 dipeptide ABC transporter ATP-binding protein [Lysinibacillus fusiformis]NOG30401.1 dipeptide ABC transporter ATP-binding protein [Lysinibacillus fusiformis]PCD81417.1 dipeptide ABC transporter ATP-binding protein [Lysinibacillus fusiformis]QAS57449.1 dipeptide ABC transporter ATP-binding protein [Lysinibacillus sphaericus]
MSKVLLKVDGLKKYFPIRKGVLNTQTGDVKAVDDVSFEVFEGETLGIVGESGCGKSTTGRLLMRLLEPTEGNIEFAGKMISELSNNEMRKARRDIQMIFQDPYASLNPRHNIGKILEEPLIVHGIGNAKERKQKVLELLEIVGLDEYHIKRYPHQFSGGQRQRIGIARALMTNPRLLIADEPVSALDVSIQAQVLNLLQKLQKDLKLTYIFISHDLGVVRHISNRVGVMYLGKLVELTASEDLYAEPLHPYTQALLSSVPVPDPTFEREQIIITGDIPSASNPPSGCTFHTRCPFKMEQCSQVVPKMQEVKPGHYVACHLYEALQH